MRIGRPRLEEREGRLAHRVPVESSLGPDELWFSVESRNSDLVTDRSEAALLGLLLPAMQRREEVRVEGQISGRFLHNLDGPFQFLLNSEFPWLERVPIRAEEIVPPPPRAPGVATGFSAGIDSFSVLADHHYGNPPPGHRLTHLLYNNVGSHGAEGNDLFAARYERLGPAVERIGLPFVAVDSNLMSFYDEKLSFKVTYTLRNAVVALLLQGGIGRSFHAAGTVLGKRSRYRPLRDIAFLDPILLPMISTEALDAVSAGGHYTRVEKTLQVA
ncbi:MAG TPA: hypothetical protein VMP42_07660, partial [Actinomycetota bacterium]|nr:hypothetical protein [Actinomycetota bacterium]